MFIQRTFLILHSPISLLPATAKLQERSRRHLFSPPCLAFTPQSESFLPPLNSPNLLLSRSICEQHYTATSVGIREPVGPLHVIPVVCLNTVPLFLKALRQNRYIRQNVASAHHSQGVMEQAFIELFCRLKNVLASGDYE